MRSFHILYIDMNMILRYLAAILLAVLPAVCTEAQDVSALEGLYAGFSSDCVVLECSYKIDAEGVAVGGECQVEIQGDRYRMKGNGLEVICDSESVWVMDEAVKEVVIEPVGDDVSSYMANPAILFRDLEKVYDVVSVSSVNAGKKYRLQARVDCGIDKAELVISGSSQIRSAVFTFDDGSVMTVNVSSMKTLPRKAPEWFEILVAKIPHETHSTEETPAVISSEA